MKIQLDHVQRLNLHALLGAQRNDVSTIRALWALQDKLALSLEEEKAIELKREFVAAQERVVWNAARTVPVREFELTEQELARIQGALEAWTSYVANADRRWLEPLLNAIATL